MIPDDLLGLGQFLHQSGDPEAALAAFEAAVEGEGTGAAWQAVATLRFVLGLPRAALAACNEALQLAPQDPDSLFNIAAVLQILGETDAALHCYQRCLASASEHAGALLNQVPLLLQMKRFDEALAAAQEALARYPGNAGMLMNLGETCLACENLPAAREAYLAVLREQPGNGKALLALAFVEASQGSLEVAAQRVQHLNAQEKRAFCSPLQADRITEFPEFEVVRIALLQAHFRMKRVEPGARRAFAELYMRAVRGDRCRPLDHPDLPHLAIASPEIDDALHLQAARQVAGRLSALVCECPPLIRPTRPKARLRLGYLSGDICAHATAFLIDGLFARHDRLRFEVFLYSSGPDDGSSWRQRIAGSVEHFRDIHGQDALSAAQRIALDSIDILIDLSCYTAYGRPAALALRPAPVQISWLGYMASSGAPWIDYVLLDDQVLLPEARCWWSESIIKIPGSMLFLDGERHDELATVTRRDCGLPEDAVIFACLCAPWKICDQAWSLWRAILDEVPASCLWLYAETPVGASNLRAAANAVGIANERLFICGKVSHAEHLARFALADVVLDTPACNGVTTTVETLLAGIPLVSLPGRRMIQRVASSLLKAHGVPELIAADAAAYVKKAVRLGLDIEWRQEVSGRCRKRNGSELFAGQQWVRHLESALMTAWRRHQAGFPPEDFAVATDR